MNVLKYYPWVKGIQVCSNDGPCPFPGGDNWGIVRKKLTTFKNLLVQNHWANFNHTWHKASVDDGDIIAK